MGRAGSTLLGALVASALVLLVVASVLPVIDTDVWWVRVLDFPRLHYLVGLVAMGLLYVALAGVRRAVDWLVLGPALLGIGYNVHKIHVYVPPHPPMAVTIDSCPAGSRLRLLIANVKMGNHRAARLIELVRDHDPDLFFAMETDAWWDEQLAVLAPLFHEHVDHFDDVESDHFGLHLFSKYPLLSPDTRFLTGEDAPAVFTGVRLPTGERISFFGIHPRPPAFGQSSLWRDTQILAAAALARQSDDPVVVAGDLNAVPWEQVVHRALRVGRLMDPRIGRGYLASYDAQQPWFWWPLDQVIFQDEFALLAFDRLPAFGSDHHPILADLCHDEAAAGWQAAPPLEDGDLAEVRRTLQGGLRPEIPQPLAAEQGRE